MEMRDYAVRIPLMFATVLLALPRGQRGKWRLRTVTEEVTDAICAKSGSHDEMEAKL